MHVTCSSLVLCNLTGPLPERIFEGHPRLTLLSVRPGPSTPAHRSLVRRTVLLPFKGCAAGLRRCVGGMPAARALVCKLQRRPRCPAAWPACLQIEKTQVTGTLPVAWADSKARPLPGGTASQGQLGEGCTIQHSP